MYRKSSRFNTALVLGALVWAMALTGCSGGGGCIPIGDGAVHVTGRVYEWRNALSDARSRVFVDESPHLILISYLCLWQQSRYFMAVITTHSQSRVYRLESNRNHT
jgi:hypothetical protein